MEASGETECSPSEKNDEEDENESGKMKDGGSSSNITVEESEKKPSSVRPYVRSKMPRLRWTADLHLRFMNAVERLGGHDRATPKLVLQLMNIKGLNIAHIKSHLQMYRSKRIDAPNQGMTDHRLFMEGVDRNIYNLSQLPLLPSFNQGQVSSNFSSWEEHRKWMQNSTIKQQTSNMTRPELFGTLTERILASQYYRSSLNLDLCSIDTRSSNEGTTWRTNKDPKDEHGSLDKHDEWLGQTRQNPSEHKRKASQFELDLELSLGLESRTVEETLSLPLNTTSPSSSKTIHKKMKGDLITENARGASTLDLTL